MNQVKQKTSTKDLFHKRSLKNQKTKLDKEHVEQDGVEYPLDIWFVISEYIKPETVGKFACICKSSYYVTTTAKFWFHLYKLYYRYVPGMPERLQPHCMKRVHGLRPCVIRTLHYTYFPLKKEFSYVSRLQQEEPHSLVRRKCALMWHKGGNNSWYFFFTLKEVCKVSNNTLPKRNTTKYKEIDDLEVLEDINANPDEGCKLLKVRCLKYSMLPPVIGLILQTVTVTLMPGLKYLRLHLGFGTSDVPKTVTNQVILNDVTSYEVLNWWHPHYPNQNAGCITNLLDAMINLTPNDCWD